LLSLALKLVGNFAQNQLAKLNCMFLDWVNLVLPVGSTIPGLILATFISNTCRLQKYWELCYNNNNKWYNFLLDGTTTSSWLDPNPVSRAAVWRRQTCKLNVNVISFIIIIIIIIIIFTINAPISSIFLLSYYYYSLVAIDSAMNIWL